MPGSESSAGASSGVSATSSRESAIEHLNKRNRGQDDDEEEDLLEQKRTWLEGFYYLMFVLHQEKPFWHDIRYNLIKIVFEGLTGFLVIFNPTVKGWNIDTGLWFWKIIRWSTYQAPIARLTDYDTYVNVIYVHVAFVFVSLGMVAAIFPFLKQAELNRRVRNAVKTVQFCTEVIFSILFMTIFNVFVFMLNCDFEGESHHNFFKDVNCVEMPHLAHMIVAAVTCLCFSLFALVQSVAICDLSIVHRSWMATPAAFMKLQVVVAKMVFMICAGCIQNSQRTQGVLVFLSALYIWWLYFRYVPFYTGWVNWVISGMWLGIAYTASIFMVMIWDPRQGSEDWHDWMTWNVLKGIFPVMVGGAITHWLFIKYKMWHVRKFRDLPANVVLRKVHKFQVPGDVELMARCVRKFDLDGDVLPPATELSETVIKAGLAYYPNMTRLLILYANFLTDVKRDGPAGRTQLQSATKQGPNPLDKYCIFVSTERSKRLKDGHEGALDLQSYVEFKRNYRTLIRTHKEALMNQRQFWKLFMHPSTKVLTIKESLREMEGIQKRAEQVYQRVMERYPGNGKVLKCFGKFLEEVRNDVEGAARFYADGNRLGSTDAMMAMDFDLGGQKKNDFLISMDLHEDAVLIIDAVGTILMVSQGAVQTFGYSKLELENSNVSMLMPQPFSQRHPSYLQRYQSTGEPHILDTTREVVALHAERFVFPVELRVTQLSGAGADAVFLGVIRPIMASLENALAWVAPNGVVLCTDQQFAGLVGSQSDELIGRPLSALTTDPHATEALLERCRNAETGDFEDGKMSSLISVVNKYVKAVPTNATVKLAGTNMERVFVFDLKKTDKTNEMLLVSDTYGTITFATWDMAALVGVPVKHLVGTKLESLLPPPYNSMHAKWLRDTPAQIPSSSCRAGVVVQILNSSNVLVPVRIRVHQVEDMQRTLHVVRMWHASPEQMMDEKRMTLTVDLHGKILDATPPDSSVFSWTAGSAKDRHVTDVLDVFEEWRKKAGTDDMQLFMLALMDRENEAPGSSWRVKVKPPDVDFATANEMAHMTANHTGSTLHELLHNTASARKAQASRPGTMLPEVVEIDGSTALKLHIFRRDLVTGYLEMDTNLSIRKADLFAGLLLGWPSTILPKVPLRSLLHVPANTRWEELMGIKVQMGVLKRVNRGTVTAPRHFMANHPDGGTMNVVMQGVSKSEGLGSKQRIEATLHVDSANTDVEPANIFRALKLEGGDSDQGDDLVLGRSAHKVGNLQRRGSQMGTGRRVSQSGSASGGRRRSSSGANFSEKRKQLEGSAAALLRMKPDDLLGDEIDMDAGAGADRADNEEDEGDQADSELGQDDEGSDAEEEKAEKGSEVSDEMQDSDGGDGADQAKKIDKANSQSQFVAQWIRAVSNMETSGNLQPIDELPEGDGNGEGDIGREEGKDADANDPFKSAGVSFPEDGEFSRGSPKRRPPTLDYDLEAANDMADEANADEEGMKASKGGGHKGKGSRGGKHDDAASESSAGDGKSEMESMSESSGVSAKDEILVDFRRGKLLKKLTKAVRGPTLMEPLTKMRTHTSGVLFGLAAVHIIMFAVFFSLIDGEERNIYMIHDVGNAADKSQATGFRAIQAGFCLSKTWGEGEIPEGNLCFDGSDPEYASRKLKEVTEVFNKDHKEVYLGSKGNVEKIPSKEALEFWEEPMWDTVMLYDTVPPRVVDRQAGLWEIGNRVIYSARELHHAILNAPQTIRDTRQYYYLNRNSYYSLLEGYAQSINYMSKYALDSQESVRNALVAILIVEAVVVATLLNLYQLKLVYDLERARFKGMLALAGLPGPILRILHNKPIVILEDDSDEEGDNEEETENKALASAQKPPEGNASAAGDSQQQGASASDHGSQVSGTSDNDSEHAHVDSSKVHPEKDSIQEPGARNGEQPDDSKASRVSAFFKKHKPKRLEYKGKSLEPSWNKTFKMLLPFVLWQIAVLVIYGVTDQRLSELKSPLSSLHMAMHVLSRFSHVRITAAELVTRADDGDKQYWKGELATEVAALEDEYNTLLYGGFAKSQKGSVYSLDTPAAAFESPQFSDRFFKEKKCFRAGESPCLEKDHEFYEASRNGLDTMMRRVLAEIKLLSQDANQDIDFRNRRYAFIHEIGDHDLHDGLEASSLLFVDFAIASFKEIKDLHIALLVVTIVLAAAYYYIVVRPYIRMVKDEANTLAGLLSHVPKELDVLSHLRGALRKA